MINNPQHNHAPFINTTGYLIIMCLFMFISPFKTGFPAPLKSAVNFINYTIKDGLPSAETYDIIQDRKGFIWVATDNGVAKFDGVTFTRFTKNDGLTDNTVFKIHEDKKGRIWFVTLNRKLCFIENDIIKVYPFNKEIEEATKNIYLGYTITHFDVDDDNNLTIAFVSLIHHPQPTLTISNSGQVSIFPNTDFVERKIPVQKSIDKNELFTGISKLFQDTNSTDLGLFQTKLYGRIRIYKWNSEFIIATPKGVHWFNPHTSQVTKQILPEFYITSVIIDFEGGVWCTSLYNGVFYVPSPDLKSFKLSTKFNKSHINCVLTLDSNILFSFNEDNNNYSASINKITTTKEPFDFFKLQKDLLSKGLKIENSIHFIQAYSEISGLIQLNSDTFLLYSPIQGFMKWYLSKEKNELKNTSLSSEDHYGNLWQRNPKGWIQKINPNEYQVNLKLAQECPKVFKIFRTKNGTILLGTIKGLYYWNEKKIRLPKSKLLANDSETRIQDITQTKDGSLFFGTKSNGIIGLTPDSILVKFTNTEGINTIYQFVYDTTLNYLYASTNIGIIQLSQINNNQWVAQKVVTKFDGIDYPDIRSITFLNEFIYFAGNGGIGQFNPLLFISKKNKTRPLLYFSSDTRKLNKLIPFDSNTFDISFQAIGYKSQNNFWYYYRLNGGNWRQSTNSTISFNSLKAGVYNFELKAKNIQGVESEIEKLTFKIQTPYWQTWWFYFLLCLFIMGICTLLIFKVIGYYKGKTAIQRKINELQALTLQSKMNPHFIFNSLNSIQNYILTNNKMEANEYLIDFSKLIRSILKTSEKNSILLSKELEILNLYVDLEKRRLRKNFSYIVNLKGNIDLVNCEIPSLLIQPYIENAIWHGRIHENPCGEIKLEIEKIENRLQLTISDNGIGIKKTLAFKANNSTSHDSVGTQITKNRIQLVSELNNQISEILVSENSSDSTNNEFVGTTIVFSIPYLTNKKPL